MRWSEAVTLDFVKIYLKHECLWNPLNPAYKLKYKRDNAYADICSEFKSATMKSMSVPEVKMKIKNLRTTYVQQVQKILQKSSPDAIYEPSLVWFHEMDRCLKNVPTNRHASSYNSPQDIPEVDSSCQIWVDQGLQNENEDEVNPDPLVPQTDDDCDSSRPEDLIPQMKTERKVTSPYKKTKKKKFKHKSIRNCSTDSDTTPMEDEFDIYGKFIATQLRKMDLQKALKLQLHIHSLVSEARISDIVD